MLQITNFSNFILKTLNSTKLQGVVANLLGFRNTFTINLPKDESNMIY